MVRLRTYQYPGINTFSMVKLTFLEQKLEVQQRQSQTAPVVRLSNRFQQTQTTFLLSMTRKPNSGLGLLIVDDSISHTVRNIYI